MCEGSLDQGVKQSEGQYFRPKARPPFKSCNPSFASRMASVLD